jgi:hypothetical protein
MLKQKVCIRKSFAVAGATRMRAEMHFLCMNLSNVSSKISRIPERFLAARAIGPGAKVIRWLRPIQQPFPYMNSFYVLSKISCAPKGLLAARAIGSGAKVIR